MDLTQRIYDRLQTEFQPEILEVINQSHLHAGHAGDNGSGHSHFQIRIKAPAFSVLSYVDRERAVQSALKEEILLLHALSIDFIR